MADTTIYVPDIGGAEGAEVVELLVAVGDVVELEQSLIVLESDKASMEIPATAAGTVKEIRVAVGDELSEGDAILVVAAEGAAAEAVSKESTAPDDSAATGDAGVEKATQAEAAAGHASGEATSSTAATTTAATTTVTIPDIGTDGEVDLIEISVEVGQSVEEGESLVVLESDKASMEVPAPASGTITKILVETGAAVREGTAIMEMSTAAAAPATSPVASEPPSKPTPQPAAAVEVSAPASAPAAARAASSTSVPSNAAAAAYAGPAVRKLAREFGVDLGKVSGSGPRGRIVKEDLHEFVKNALKQGPATATQGGSGIPAVPEVDFSKFGEIDPQPRSRVDKVTAANMTRSWLNVPHVTQFDDADITELENFRNEMKADAERRGTKLTPMPFIIKACAAALNANPKLKSSLADGGETLVYKKYCHIGMAVDTPAGLVVPVIRDVDKKSVWELSEEILELAGLARDKKLKPDQMQGGVFTVSSLGNIGGRGFTPIVNAPEVAILGVSRADMQPVWNGKDFVPRKMLPLSLSYDHRVINGGDAGRFLTQLVGLLADIRRILM